MAAWARLALLRAAIDNDSSLERIADSFGYESIEPSVELFSEEPEAKKVQPSKTLNTKQSSEIKASPPQLPKTLFILPLSKRYLNANTEQPPKLKQEALPQDHSSGTYHFAAPQALFHSSRLFPLFLNVLGYSHRSQKVDAKKLSQQCGSGKVLTRLPRVHSQNWPKKLLVIADPSREAEPYWGDYKRIIRTLKQLLGESAVLTIRFYEETLEDSHPLFSLWPRNKNKRGLFRWHPQFMPEAVLILSDLGAIAENELGELHAYPLKLWLQNNILEKNSVRALNLSPAGFSSCSEELSRSINPSPLLDRQKTPRQRQPKGYHFPAADSEAITKTLAALAYLPLFDVGLLRKLRLALQLGGSELESKIWNHEHIEHIGVGCKVSAAVAEHYREIYRQHFRATPEGEKIWQVLKQHQRFAYEGLKKMTALMQYEAEPASSTEEDRQAIINYFHRLSATAAQETLPDLQQSIEANCSAVFHCLPSSLKNREHELTCQLAAMGYKSQLQEGEWPEALPLSLEPYLRWARKSGLHSHPWQVKQFSLGGELSVTRNVDNSQSPVHWCFADSVNAIEKTPLQVDWANENVAQSQRDSFVQHEVNSQHHFSLSREEKCCIRSTGNELNIQAQSRPPWAKKMGYRDKQLFTTVRHINENQRAFWQPETTTSSEAQTWAWHLPEPIEKIDKDKYGHYADLNLFGQTQRFRWIDAGSFLMGSPKKERGRYEREVQHQVTLTQGFWLADTAVSQALWQAVMGKNPSHFQGEDLPVENVSWDDCQAFIQQLMEKHPHIKARLPTEAEWEFACRAGETSAFSWGDSLDLSMANYCGDWEDYKKVSESAVKQTCSIKSYSANGNGLFQMHGNVFEWCQDWFAAYTNDALVDPEGPAEPEDKDSALRVLRGGSWLFEGRGLRSAYRLRVGPGDRDVDAGFRLALGRELRGGGAASQAGFQVAAGQRQGGPQAREKFSDKVKKFFNR